MGVRRPITFEIDARGCHVCTSHVVRSDGYPALYVGDRQHHMHRVLFAEAFGEIPAGLVVMHKCDNRRCINLDHLRLGTPGDNARDRNEKGRNNPPVGTRAGNTHLSLDDVEAIRSASGTQIAIAARFGITQPEVSRIRNRKRWANANPQSDA